VALIAVHRHILYVLGRYFLQDLKCLSFLFNLLPDRMVVPAQLWLSCCNVVEVECLSCAWAEALCVCSDSRDGVGVGQALAPQVSACVA